jgi:hypothetical protein
LGPPFPGGGGICQDVLGCLGRLVPVFSEDPQLIETDVRRLVGAGQDPLPRPQGSFELPDHQMGGEFSAADLQYAVEHRVRRSTALKRSANKQKACARAFFSYAPRDSNPEPAD